jgi:hypothetical protein
MEFSEQHQSPDEPHRGSDLFSTGIMGMFLRLLAVAYAAGLVLHFMDLTDQRYNFSSMTPPLKVWSVCLFVGYFLAATGLWFRFAWGVVAFITLAAAQWIGAIAFPHDVGRHWLVLGFHVAAVLSFVLVYLITLRSRR